MSNIAISSTVLLTGAGFTKGFGGYLAAEVDGEIWKECGSEARRWITRKKEINFEYLYEQARQEPPIIRDQITSAIRKVFFRMDNEICARVKSSVYESQRIPSAAFSNFVSWFGGDKSGAALISSP